MAQTMDQTRKVGLKYDGNSDPLDFIERVEKLARSHQLHFNVFPTTMPELLKDSGFIWFRNNSQPCSTWKEFKRDLINSVLPNHYFDRLEDDIRERCQKSGEGCEDFVLALQILMRHVKYSETQKLDRIIDNVLADIQLCSVYESWTYTV